MKKKQTSTISPNGWYRILDLGWSSTGGAFFLLSLTNTYVRSAPYNLLFLIGTGNYGTGNTKSNPFIQQIGRGNNGNAAKWIQQLRIVKDGNSSYLDILFATRTDTGNKVNIGIIPFYANGNLFPDFVLGSEIGTSLTELSALTVDYLT